MTKLPTTWRTKEGKTIRIADMDDSHLRNCVRLIERMVRGDESAVRVLTLALAQWKPSSREVFVLRQLAQQADDPVLPLEYWALRAEAEKRGVWLGQPGGRKPDTLAEEEQAAACTSRLFDFSL